MVAIDRGGLFDIDRVGPAVAGEGIAPAARTSGRHAPGPVRGPHQQGPDQRDGVGTGGRRHIHPGRGSDHARADQRDTRGVRRHPAVLLGDLDQPTVPRPGATAHAARRRRARAVSRRAPGHPAGPTRPPATVSRPTAPAVTTKSGFAAVRHSSRDRWTGTGRVLRATRHHADAGQAVQRGGEAPEVLGAPPGATIAKLVTAVITTGLAYQQDCRDQIRRYVVGHAGRAFRATGIGERRDGMSQQR